MALPQDGQNANGLTKVTQIPAGKELMFIDPTTNEGGIITLEDLTKQILNGLASQAFALDAGQMTLLAALNKLNSETPRKNVTSLEEYIKTAPYGISLCDCQIAKDNPTKGQMSICLSYVDEQHKWALQYVFSYNKIFYRVMNNLVFNDWAKIVG